MRAIARRRQAGGRADRRRRHQGRRARQGRRPVHHDRRPRPRRSARVAVAARRCVPAIRMLALRTHRRSRHHRAAGARRHRSRSRSAIGYALGASRSSRALLDAAGAGLRWMRDPTRGGVATALNELARDSGLGIVLRGRGGAGARRRARRLRAARPRSAAHRQRRAVPRRRRARAGRRGPGAPCAAVPGGEAKPRSSARCATQPPRTVLAIASYGGTRVVDMLVGDPLPRIC